MFETIREFGLEQLAWTGELEPLRRRHAEYFLSLAERAEPALGGPDARSWLDRLELEHDNLRAALEWSLGQPGLARPPYAWPPRWRGSGGSLATSAREVAGRIERSRTRPPGRERACGRCTAAAGWPTCSAIRALLGDCSRKACPSPRSCRTTGRAPGSCTRSDVWRTSTTTPPARAQLGEQSLRIAEALDDRWLIAWALHLLALAAYIAGDDARAHAYYEETLSIRRELGHLEGLVIVLHLKGMVHQRAGDLPAALALYREALDHALQLNSAWFFRCVLPLFASIAAERQPEIAARLGGAVTVMSESAHTLPIPITEAHFTEGVQVARRKLGEAAFEAAWAQGRGMSLDTRHCGSARSRGRGRRTRWLPCPPDAGRGRSLAPSGERAHDARDRGRAGCRRVDGRSPHHPHLSEDRASRPGRGSRVRTRARPHRREFPHARDRRKSRVSRIAPRTRLA